MDMIELIHKVPNGSHLSKSFLLMKNSISKPFIFLSSLIVMGILGALYSAMVAGVFWGISTIAAPETTFKLMGGLICPSDAELQFTPSEVDAASPASTVYTVDCVFEDGTLQSNINTHASNTVFAAYFLMVLIPTFITGAILMGPFLLR
jgi:hypothetical protein